RNRSPVDLNLRIRKPPLNFSAELRLELLAVRRHCQADAQQAKKKRTAEPSASLCVHLRLLPNF
ncbi:MAG TPA: hypothetical protein VF175_16950, partial [Lacipirellula sp.]